MPWRRGRASGRQHDDTGAQGGGAEQRPREYRCLLPASRPPRPELAGSLASTQRGTGAGALQHWDRAFGRPCTGAGLWRGWLASCWCVVALQPSSRVCWSWHLSSRVRKAPWSISQYLSRDLPYELSADDVYLTSGCTQAIEVISSVLARPGANILLPRPGYLFYEARAVFNSMEARYFDLVPERGWEVDIDNLRAVADKNTVAMVIINPGNPCGNVYTYEHLAKIAETARELGIFVIADEVYAHLTFGERKFVPMGVFGSVAPVLTLGSISKRWVVPGWRLGWIVTNDPNGVFHKTKVADSIKSYLDISSDPVTFVQVAQFSGIMPRKTQRFAPKLTNYLCQGAIPQLMGNTKEEFFNKTIEVLRQTADICWEKLKGISCITCPSKPEGSMFVMVKLDLSCLQDIKDDMNFCCQLAKEELVVVLPGCAVGYKNWLRITFAIAPYSLEDGLDRLKSFCLRHSKPKDVV